MRWEYEWVERVTVRRRSRFLLLPKRIGDIERWLERAEWEEKWTVVYTDWDSGVHWGWRATRWLDLNGEAP